MRFKDLIRIFKKIQFNYNKIYNGTPCWEWTGRLDKDRYAKAKFNGKYSSVHREMFIHFVRPFLFNEHAHHLCRNRKCLNYLHIQPLDAHRHSKEEDRGWHNRNKTCCPYGHPYNEKNTKRCKNGARGCKECDKIKHRIRGGFHALSPEGKRTHCRKGHELTPENTIIAKNGNRLCRLCRICHEIREQRKKRKKEKAKCLSHSLLL